jgi:hypothetical protein
VESALPFLLDLKVFGISTYKKLLRGTPDDGHQDLREATKSGERDTCGQKQIPRPKFGLVMTAGDSEDAGLKTPALR